MEKYVVKISSVFSTFIEVDAENEEEARKLASEIFQNNEKTEESQDHVYDGTFDMEEWPVAKKSDLQKIAEQEIQEDNKL